MNTTDKATRPPNYPHQINGDKTMTPSTPALRFHDAEACALGQRPCPSPAAFCCAPAEAGASISASEKENAARHYGAMAIEARAACLQQSAEPMSEQDAGLLEQAASFLEALANDERNRGNSSTAEGAACSAHAVRRLAVQLLQAAPPVQAANCGMCGAKNVTPTEIGDCPRCHWDELTPAPAQEHLPDWLPFSARTKLAERWGVKVTPAFNAQVRDVIETYIATHGAIAAAPAQAQEDARDADFEAVRKVLCKLPKYSFIPNEAGNVRRVNDASGNWVEFDAVHKLFDPVAVDAARAAQGGAA